jgi:hypothetical protein
MYVYKEQVRRATWRQPCYFVCVRASRCGQKFPLHIYLHMIPP